MSRASQVRFLIVSDDIAMESYLRHEFMPCSAARTCAVTSRGLRQTLSEGLPPGPWDVVILAAGGLASPDDIRRLLASAPGARLIVVLDEDEDEDSRRAFLAAGATTVMNRTAAAATSFHGIRPCLSWRRRQTQTLMKLRTRINTLRGLEARRREFLDAISHELRSPLTVVSASIRMLQEEAEKHGDQERLSLTKMAARNCDHMLHRVLALLERSKLESGVAVAHPSVFDLKSLALESAEACRLATERPLTLSVREFGPLPPAFADRVMVEEVLENLLDNAVRFARSKVVVALLSSVKDGAVQVCVIDDGPGIDQTMLQHLFERFLQGPRPGVAGYTGTGLGLGICRDLLALNGGRIWAEAPRRHGGRLHFTLPAVAQAKIETPHASAFLAR